MSATDVGIGPFELDEPKGLGPVTIERLREVQNLVDAGETEENIARFIAGHGEFTHAEKVIARVVVARWPSAGRDLSAT